MRTASNISKCPPPCFATAIAFGVDQKRLFDLLAHRHHRVQRILGVLHDHGDPRTPNTLAAVVCSSAASRSMPSNSTRRAARARPRERKQPENGSSRSVICPIPIPRRCQAFSRPNSKLTPRTACTGPLAVSKVTWRSSTRNSGVDWRGSTVTRSPGLGTTRRSWDRGRREDRHRED